MKSINRNKFHSNFNCAINLTFLIFFLVAAHKIAYSQTTCQNASNKEIFLSLNEQPQVKPQSKPIPELQTDVRELTISYRYTSERYPVLNVVFFGDKSDRVPGYYHRSPETLYSEEVYENPLDMNSSLFSILSKRLKEDPRITIELSGFADRTTEVGDCDLARRRAEAVRDFFVKNWAAPASQISIKQIAAPCSPIHGTKSKTPDGFEDNRRVEISSNNPALFEPIIIPRHLEFHEVMPSLIRVNMMTSKFPNPKSWTMKGYIGAALICSRDGLGSIPEEIILDLSITNDELSDNKLSLVYEIIDRDGNRTNSTTTIPITQDISDLETNRLSLLLFHVNSPEMRSDSKLLLDSFLKSSQNPFGIRIKGFSDNIGNADYNIRLSEQRVRAVEKYIAKRYPEVKIIEARGYGATDFPEGIKSYDTAAERFLSRTVYVELLQRREK